MNKNRNNSKKTKKKDDLDFYSLSSQEKAFFEGIHSTLKKKAILLLPLKVEAMIVQLFQISTT